MWGESMNVRFYHAAILTLSGERTFSLIQGELWVRGNKIAYIGDGTDRHARDFCWEREIDAQGTVLMPGFKNAHTHTAMTFLRSYADDLPLEEWLQKQV